MAATQSQTGLLDAPRRWLEQAPGPVFAIYAGVMAFGVYFAMYAFRRPFAVASYADVASVGIDFKVALVIAQVFGYALAKFIGVKVIAELPANRRVIGILLQIGLAEVALVLFAVIPPPWNIACLFLDGLALGMIWGMVFAFVEGRRQSELIGAMLCASFILSSGVVKSVGQMVMLRGIAGEFWMPAVTGLIFAPVLLICLTGLAILPKPNAADIAARVERAPMNPRARNALIMRFGPGLAVLVALYVMLTALRDLRDNFAAEIWAELGLGGKADIFAWSEVPISIVVLGAMAALTLVKDNRNALVANFGLMGLGLALTGVSSLAFNLHLIGPVAWMIAIGGGLYLAYTPYNGLLFDQLVAATGEIGTAGFLIYLADSSGYAGSVALLLVKNFSGLQLHWARFLIEASMITSVLGLALLAWAAAYFYRQIATQP